MDSLLWNAPPSKPTVRPLVRIQLSLVAIGLMALVGYLNFHAGFFITLSMFYLFPILLGAIWVSVRFGLVLCFAASFLWVWSEIATGRPYGAAWSVIWNWLTRGAVFAAFCVLLEMFLRERRQSLQDPLTGIANRRWFVIFAAQEIRRFRRYHQPFTALYLDCDDFKSVNDRLGHTGGDRLIRDIASTLSKLVRSSDCVARLGGDEFGVLLLQTEPDKAQMTAEKLRRELRSSLEKLGWRVSFSIGAVTYLSAPGSVDDILRASDACMYGAKKRGKNSVYHEIIGNFTGDRPKA
jgi:diguanylate cyclase (GGDEF)-like protein